IHALPSRRSSDLGLDEVVAMLAVDPAGPQDQVAVERGPDGILASQPRRTVHVGRRRRVGFPVRLVAVTGKHVFAGKVEQGYAELAGRFGEIGDTMAIDRLGLSDLGLGVI